MAEPVEIERGLRFMWRFRDSSVGEIRVMSVADGYAMVRRPGCMPFVMGVKEIAAALRAGTDREGER